MNEESEIEVLREEIETLRNRADQQSTYIGILGVFVATLVVLVLLASSGGFVFLAVVVFLILPIGLGLRSLEQRGI